MALVIILSSPSAQGRVAEAWWGQALVKALRRMMEEDSHLKGRVHAAAALQVLPSVDAYGAELGPVLSGALRGLRQCRGRDLALAVGPVQMRLCSRALRLKPHCLITTSTRGLLWHGGGPHGRSCHPLQEVGQAEGQSCAGNRNKVGVGFTLVVGPSDRVQRRTMS
ncbi:unnamed protein product [Discosporangium mesarthrocarpum]